ncbi:hypothetical protein AAC387_Pa03g2753 [Persea americana]
MMRASNTVLGLVNFATFLLSFPILAGGIWLSAKANQADCMRFLQWPFLALGLFILVISLMGFAGACYRISWLLWLYLFAMFLVIATLFALVVFVFAVTSKGAGRPVINRSYLDFYLSDYSGWLKDRVSDEDYWAKISSCLREARICRKIGRSVGGLPESPDLFYLRHLSPIQSGCCKPPTECNYTYINETVWNPSNGITVAESDCLRWSNDQDQLCYSCGSCKAGVLASLEKSWRKVSVMSIILLVILVFLYGAGLAAFRNNRRIDSNEPFGENRMTKLQPTRIHL